MNKPRMPKRLICMLLFFTGMWSRAQTPFVTEKGSISSSAIVVSGELTAIYVDSAENILLKRSAAFLQQDIEMVTGIKPVIISKVDRPYKKLIVIGTIQQSVFLQHIIQKKLINTSRIKGRWEAYQLQYVPGSPTFMPMGNMLVIAGSDRRGAAYGVFEFSKQIGVSPWYWWADVPVKKKAAIFINNHTILIDSPRVKYRGIFINDEAPAFAGWAKEKFGGVNHQVYEKIFELILRLKGNYLWPAMWGNAFNDDDTLNPILADEYGIVMGTSHHEPMLRSQQEWKRFGSGKWDYDSNEVALKKFWKKGIENMGTHESIVTVGMRGDGDKPMAEGTATALLERIVRDQRQLITEVTKKPASATPQLWALYKEVQDYYDKGMRVPDDVTLLLCDDNWGNIRKLPRLDEKPRAGGYGIYYHFDYVGGPRNYKWLNTNPIPRVWEQMHMAWEYNASKIWIVNVGDIKPMEFPISFFLDYAWNPTSIGPADLQKYTEQWSAGQFGKDHAKEIAEVISKYSKYNGRRKPELLDQNTYDVGDGEFFQVTKNYVHLLGAANALNDVLPPAYRNAFFQLVLHPVKACANLYDMYHSAALNARLWREKNIIANERAEDVKLAYLKDSLISAEYNKLNNGKWNHMMDQTHIGYTYWQQPLRQKMPEVKYLTKDSTIEQDTAAFIISAPQEIPGPKTPLNRYTFFERNTFVSMSADHFTRAVNSKGVSWTVLPDHGRTGSAITPFPVTAPQQKPGTGGPHLEYEFYTFSKDSFRLSTYFSPTLNFHNTSNGLQFAVSVDDDAPQVISLNKDDNKVRIWEKWVANNIIIKTTGHFIREPGKHILKFWMVDPGVVLQKLLVNFGQPSSRYLGPEETMHQNYHHK